jgi:hypothetical protein
MATLQHEALKAIAGSQEEAFAFCELHGVYYHPMEPTYLTMGRIASWALLMKNVEIPNADRKTAIHTIHGDVNLTLTGTTEGWESGKEDAPMSQGGQA